MRNLYKLQYCGHSEIIVNIENYMFKYGNLNSLITSIGFLNRTCFSTVYIIKLTYNFSSIIKLIANNCVGASFNIFSALIIYGLVKGQRIVYNISLYIILKFHHHIIEMIFSLKLYFIVLMINSGIYQVINTWFHLDLLQS